MLNADILLLVYEQCDLESCVALSQVCRLNQVLYSHLGHMIRKKVQTRVPWITRQSVGAKTWRQCAAIVVARSRKGMDTNNNKHLYLLKDLSVAVSLGRNDTQVLTCVDLQKDEDTRTRMTPVFTGENCTKVTPGDVQKGHSLLYPGIALDLATMITSKSKYTAALYREYHLLPNEATSPSGLVVRHENRNFAVHIMAENENLLHVRYRHEGQSADSLIYKHEPRDTDKDGAILITAQTMPTFYGPPERFDRELQGSVVSLLPGHGGALVVTAPFSHDHMKMLLYVEPDAPMKYVLICTLPATTTYRDGYSDFDTRFFTTYNGYLFLYYEGRLVRLWVDLGYRSPVSTVGPTEYILRQEVTSRCLTVWDRNFPLIGGFDSAELGFYPRGHRISRGWTPNLKKYVTVGAACGTAFGDLSSGKTYYSRNSSTQGLTMPLWCDDQIKFGVIGPHVSKSLVAAMLLTNRASTHGLDLSGDFDFYCEQAERQREKLTARTDLATLQDKSVPFSDDTRDVDRENEDPLDGLAARTLRAQVIVPGSDEEGGEDSDSDSEYDSDFADGPPLTWYDDPGDERNHRYGDVTDDEEEEEEEDDDEEAYLPYKNIFRELPLVELNNVTMNHHDEFDTVDDFVIEQFPGGIAVEWLSD